MNSGNGVGSIERKKMLKNFLQIRTWAKTTKSLSRSKM